VRTTNAVPRILATLVLESDMYFRYGNDGGADFQVMRVKLPCNKRILVSGGAGYIGRWLVQALRDTPAVDIVVLDNNPEYLHQLSELVQASRVRLLYCDLSDEKQVEEIAPEIVQANWIVHLAATLSTSQDVTQDGAREFVNNVLPLIHLLKYASDRLEVLCFTSSMSVYGCPYALPVAETHPTEPIWLYGLSKLACEKLLQIYAAQHALTTISLRICGVYGRDTLGHRNAIPTFIRQALKGQDVQINGDGQQIRDYIHIDDVIKGIIQALEADKSGIYNLGSGEGWPIRQVARFVVQQSASNSCIHFVRENTARRRLDYVSDITLIERALQFYPGVSIVDGITKEVEWIRSHEG